VVAAPDYAVPTSLSTTVPDDANPGDTVYVDYDTVTPVVGSIFNSLGLGLSGAPIPVDLTSHPIGPFGALIGESQIVGILLGDGWDNETTIGSGKDKVTIEGPATPPLINLIAPHLPDGFFGDGSDGASGSTEALSDVVSGGDTLADAGNGFF
jgi:hypothetical protein